MRDYLKIAEEITLTGFFSEYLPPCFSVDNKILCIGAPPQKTDLIEPYCFSMSRYDSNDSRRNIFIPEIASYLAVYFFMLQNDVFKELIEFTEGQDSSFSPILGKDNSVYKHEQSYDSDVNSSVETPSDYLENVAKKIKRSRGAKQIIKLDIANCFASFYTHMTPAIILGLEEADKQHKNDLHRLSVSDTYRKYALLDKLLRQQNQNRTNGLLTGPLLSKMIAEGILTRIDIELKEKGLVFSRYVDDFEVYLYGNDRDIATQTFTNTLRRYCFSLNNEKTEVIDYPYYVVKNLEKVFQKYSKDEIENFELMDLFTSFSVIEKEGTKGALHYLLKSIEKNPINAKDDDLYKAYLFTILENDKRSLPKICSLLIGNKKAIKVTTRDKQFINGLIKKHLVAGQDLEVIWLAYLLSERKLFKNNKTTVKMIIESNNELAKLILYRGGLLCDEDIKIICETSVSWIMLYELFCDERISEDEIKAKLNLDKNVRYYRKLKSEGIHFCV